MTQPPFSGAPAPVQGVTGGPGLPQGVASVDGTTGNVIVAPPNNTIQFKKTDTPQSLQVYEYSHSTTDFARISLNAQTGGPFQLAVETAPAGTLRDLAILSPQNINVTAATTVTIASQAGATAISGTNGVNLTTSGTGGIGITSAQLVNIQAQTSINLTTVTSHMILTVQGVGNRIILKTQNTDRWHILDTGHLVTPTDNSYDIGQPGSQRPRNMYLAGSMQVSAGSTIFSGNGAPSAGLGVNGDFYFNQTGGATTSIYMKRSGAWVGVV